MLANLTQPLTSYALVDLDAVEHNVRAIHAHTGPEVALIAVVKANAYGHGAIPIARAALAAGASRLAVARVDEGIQLRRAGLDAPILILGYAIPAEADAIARHDLSPAVTRVEVAQALSERAQALGRTLRVHVKVDTGMGRFGLLPDEVLPFLARISALPALQVEGIFTHFAASDSPDQSFTHQQLGAFEQVLAAIRAAGYSIPIRHAANSAAALDVPAAHFDAVRIGIAMYGLAPSDEVEPAISLRPALSLHSRIARLRTLPAGSSVGYGRSHICHSPTRVALIPFGYGDGYHRILSNQGHVLIGGQRVPLIGRVSMDQITADVAALDAVQEDDDVVLLGTQGSQRISAEEIARLAGTVNYEVTTSLLARLPRVYRRGGAVVEVARLAEP